MKVQLLYFDGCPNVDATRDAVRAALAATGASAECEEVDTSLPGTPAALRGWGSPTVLVDGVDVAGQAQPDGSSCRLYAGGRAPSHSMIRDAIHAAGAAQRPRRLAGASIAGAIVGAVAASACCIVPAVLALVGVSGVGLAAVLEPWRPVFLGATAVLLGVGFYAAYRQRPKPAAACDCPTPRASRAARRMLWIASVLVVGLASYPYLAAALGHETATGSAAPVANAATVRIQIEGMTCSGCASGIASKLAKTEGVIKAKVSYADRSATVTYDPAKTDVSRIRKVIEKLGYKTSLIA